MSAAETKKGKAWQACVAVSDPDLRLDCYDSFAAALEAGSRPAPPVSATSKRKITLPAWISDGQSLAVPAVGAGAAVLLAGGWIALRRRPRLSRRRKLRRDPPSARPNHRESDIELYCRQRFNRLLEQDRKRTYTEVHDLLREGEEQRANDTALQFYVRFWELQREQFDYWAAGKIADVTYYKWAATRRSELRDAASRKWHLGRYDYIGGWIACRDRLHHPVFQRFVDALLAVGEPLQPQNGLAVERAFQLVRTEAAVHSEATERRADEEPE